MIQRSLHARGLWRGRHEQTGSPFSGLELLEQRVLLSSVVLGADLRQVSFRDADGDHVTVRLAGPGTATFDVQDGADLSLIQLQDTTRSTRLDIRVRPGWTTPTDGATSIGAIEGDDIGVIHAPRVRLIGAGVVLAGSLGQLTLRSLGNGADVLLADPRAALRISLGDVSSTVEDVSLISVGQLASLRVLGRVSHLTIQATGDVKGVDLFAETEHLNLRTPGRLGRLSLHHRTGQAPALSASSIGAAGGIGQVLLAGSLLDSVILAGVDFDASFALDSASFDTASIRVVKVRGDVIDSVIAAGGDPGADGLFADGEILPGGRIGRVQIGGVLAGVNSPHANPGIYAATLGAVHVSGHNLTGKVYNSSAGVIGAAVIDPLPEAPNALSAADVEEILEHAIARAQQLGLAATISVVDREGNILAVVRMAGAEEFVDISAGGAGGLEAVDGVVKTSLIAATKAGTAAFLSTSAGNAFTTRTAGYIIQRHFPPGIAFQDSGPLFGVQLSSLPTSDVNRLPLGLSADPGGLPLYRRNPATGKMELLGGIGVEVDGLYTVDPSRVGGAATGEELIALAGQIGFQPPRAIRANRIFVDGLRLDYANAAPPRLAALGVIDDLGAVPGLDVLLPPRSSPATSLFATAGLALPNGRTLIGEVPNNALLDFFDDGAGSLAFLDGAVNAGQQLTAADVAQVLGQAHQRNRTLRAMIRAQTPRPQRSQVSVAVVDLDGNVLGVFRTADAPVFGYDVAVQKARTVAFMNRPDAGVQLSALDAELAADIALAQGLGIFDVANPFARHVDAAAALGIDLDGTIAMADRTLGFLSRPDLPDGIPDGPRGPFTAQGEQSFSPFNTGLQTALIIPNLVEFLLAYNGMDEAAAITAFADGAFALPPSVVPNQAGQGVGLPGNSLANGMQIFAGGVPLYKDGLLVGAIGVSGDGIEQDDFIAFSGAAGFQQFGADITRADRVVLPQEVRLPYVKLPRSPFRGV